MASNLETILTKVLKRVNPSKKEEKKVLQLADNLVEKVKTAAKKNGVKVRVRVEGSVAKGTWVKGEPDIDIFMQLPLSTPREAFGTTCLNIAKEATKGSTQVERFAEHPYLEAIVNGTRVNIVPCYKARFGEWVSATDRTPFHTDYVMPRLDERLRSEIRLLKQFMKGIGVYGAEIKVGGFSGYLCELLVLRYNSFVGVLKAAADLREMWLIDYEDYYKGRENELPKIFEDSLVVVDPVDKGRNVASAVRPERVIEFVAASRKFLEKPSMMFFYPRETRAFSAKKLGTQIKRRGFALVFVKFGRVKTVSDILWGQLYKTQRSLRRMLTQSDFRVVNSAVWSDEKSLNLLLFEVEDRYLPPAKKHIGPPIEKRRECERFLHKHLGTSTTISGPHLENSRWVVEVKRKHADIVELLRDGLRTNGRQVGVADLISKAMTSSMKILVNEEIKKTYLSSHDFAKFLTEYIKGKPKWL